MLRHGRKPCSLLRAQPGTVGGDPNMNQFTHPEGPSMLEKRKIEAEILKEVYETLKESHGEEVAKKTISESVRRSAIEQARAFAAAAPGGPSLKAFQNVMPLWTKGGALEIEVKEQTDRSFAFNVVRCRYAETYKAMGLGEIPVTLPYIKKKGLEALKENYSSSKDAADRLPGSIISFYQKTFPDLYDKRSQDINQAAQAVLAVYRGRDVEPFQGQVDRFAAKVHLDFVGLAVEEQIHFFFGVVVQLFVVIEQPRLRKDVHPQLSTAYSGYKIAPLLRDFDVSRNLSRSTPILRPMPLHSGHMPCGSLNEKALE
jgi:hypothetical protein